MRFRDWFLLLFAAAVLWTLIGGIAPAPAHTTADLNAWVEEWRADWPPTQEAFTEWDDMVKRHPCFFTNDCPATNRRSNAGVAWSGDIEQWRPLVERYFQPADVEWAMAIMACESGGNPNAVGPTNDHGLFQHLGQYWASRSAAAGWAGANIYDPEANIAVAAWLFYTGGAGHWVCKA